jgi:acetylornithine/succinyldiaminopimelate/putrescine aminotransferase
VVIANHRIARSVEPGDQGSTFGGNPLASAGIRATYRIIRDEGLLETVRSESARVMAALRSLRRVREVRGLGYLIGVECDAPAKDIQDRLLEERILVGTCSEPRTLRLLPPLTLATGEWDQFLDVFEKILAETGAGGPA